MNDPNGMFVDAEGVYHLYYQCMLPQLDFPICAMLVTNKH